jgi:hypothetical protein
LARSTSVSDAFTGRVGTPFHTGTWVVSSRSSAGIRNPSAIVPVLVSWSAKAREP